MRSRGSKRPAGRKLPTYEDLNPNTKFVENKAIALLASSQTVNDYLSSHKLNWARYPELIKLLYTRLLASDYYRRYMQNPTRTFSRTSSSSRSLPQRVEDCGEGWKELWKGSRSCGRRSGISR